MKTPLLLSLFALTAASALAAPFQAGDLVLLRLDNGANALTSAATAGYLDEYTSSGVFVQSVPLPTAVAGANDALTFAGNSASEGQLRLSADGQFLTIIGYNAAPGTLNPAGTAPGTVNRVIGRIDSNGNVDSSTAISASTFTSNPRGVVTDNGTRFWASSGSGNGTFYIAGTGGSATANQLGTAATRTLGIYGNQLYASTANANPGFGLASVGTGLPTGSASLALLNGFPTSSTTRSTWGFAMADLNAGIAGVDTAWVADDKTTGGDAPGVQKWTFDGTQWSSSYTISTGAGTGARALTVDTTGSSPVVYVTTTDNKLEKIVDTGASSTAQLLVAGTGNTFFRGVDFAPMIVPEPRSVLLAALAGFLAWNRRRATSVLKPALIPLLIFCFLARMAQAQNLQLQPLTTFGSNGDGSILPGQRPYLTDGSTNAVVGSGGVHELQRSMAYNPTTGHLLILSRTNTATAESYYIAIIDALTGADIGNLSLGTPGIGGNGNFDFNSIAVADDGGIYVCDQTSSSQTSGRFNLYYWASESASMNFVWSGDPSSGSGSGGNARWGDSMVATGTGTDTKVLVSSRGNVVAILTPTDPSLTAPWACATISTTVPSGNIGFALAYGAAGNTFYAQAANGPLYLFNYTWTNSLAQAAAPTAVMAGTATNVQTYPTTAFPQWTGAIGILSQSNLLAGLEMPPGPAANVRLYGITNTAIPPVLLDRKAWVTNESGNGVFAGSIFFVNTNVYALNSDNGIMAYRVVSAPAPHVAPAIILNPLSETASLANNALPFIGAADGSAPLAYQWYFNTNTLLANATNSSLTITNVQLINFGSYQVVVTNSYGSATSVVANLSEAVTFKNGVVYEPFNYPAGLPLQNLGGWVTNTASAAVQVQGCYMVSGSLSGSGLPASIGSHYLWASNVTVRLPFGSQTNGPLYFSFLHRGTNITGNTTTEDPIGGLAYNSSTTLYPKIDCVWTDSNHYSVGIAKGTGVAWRTNDTQVFTGADTVFIVCCFFMTNGNSGSDIVQLWVNPDPATFGTAAPPVPNCVTNAGNGGAAADPGPAGVDRISWRGTANSFQHEVDEVRIGFTWAAVTPPTPVSLTVSASGNNAVVSWPASAVGWTLSGTTNLTSDPWTTKTPIVVQGTNNTFTVTGAVGQQFFRLTR